MNIGKFVRDSLTCSIGSSVTVPTHDTLRESVSYSVWDLVNLSLHDSVRKIYDSVRSLRR